jgi:polyribonucleotide nucleotidyltransferase
MMVENNINMTSNQKYTEIISGEYSPPTNTHYTQIDLFGKNEEIMKIVIGKHGKVFKAITHQSGVQYIWYNIEHNRIEIWGPEDKLQDAYTRLITRLYDINSKVLSGTIKLKKEETTEMNIE